MRDMGSDQLWAKLVASGVAQRAAGCAPPGGRPPPGNGAGGAACGGAVPRPPSKAASARDDIMQLLQPAGRDPVWKPYCLVHLQMLLESRYPAWCVKDALGVLAREGLVATFNRDSVRELNGLKAIQAIKLYADPRAMESEAGRQAAVESAIEQARLLEEYHHPDNSKPRGDHLESLIRDLLKTLGFVIEGVHTREYGGRRWTESKDNLDIIARRPGSGLTIGVEVKNELGVMEKKEIRKKVEICRHLGVVPVFGTRQNAPHTEYIRECGGFNWSFGAQIVPSAQRDLVARLLRTLPEGGIAGEGGQRRELPIVVRDDLPEDSVKMFEMWLRRAEGTSLAGAWSA